MLSMSVSAPFQLLSSGPMRHELPSVWHMGAYLREGASERGRKCERERRCRLRFGAHTHAYVRDMCAKTAHHCSQPQSEKNIGRPVALSASRMAAYSEKAVWWSVEP